MKTLVIGTGGREHALALALSRDPSVTEVHVAPGNPGMAAVADAATTSTRSTAPPSPRWPRRLGADLVVVGPEAPLVAGVADAVRAAGIACFGPSARGRAARGLQGVRQAGHGRRRGAHRAGPRVRDARAGRRRARRVRPAVRRQGRRARRRQGRRRHRRPAGGRRPRGGLRPGRHRGVPRRPRGLPVRDHRRRRRSLPLQPAQDFKRALDGDAGPNTGGMGAYTPLPWAPDDLVAEVTPRVLVPTVAGDGPPRHAVPGPALRRPRADQPRRAGRRVQRPLRRPRDPGAARAARHAAVDAAARRRHRHARRGRPAAVEGRAPPSRSSIAVRELPRTRRAPATSSTASRPPTRSTVSTSSTPAPRATPTGAGDRRWARARRSPRSAPPSPKRASARTPAST